jgi:hypothetical protein
MRAHAVASVVLAGVLALGVGNAPPEAEVQRESSSTCDIGGVPQRCVVRVRLSKAAATVADRLELVVEAEGPEALRVEWPRELDAPASIAGLTVLAHDESVSSPAPGRRLERRAFALEAFLPGARELAGLEVRFVGPGGGVCTLGTEALRIEVASVLPAGEGDVAAPELRGLVSLPPEPTAWYVWVGAGAGVFAVATIAAVAVRRRGRATQVVVSPYEQALARLKRLEEAGVADEPARYAGELGETLRAYIPAALALTARDRTTDELLAELPADPALNGVQLRETLVRLDEVAFGDAPAAGAELMEIRDRVYGTIVALQARRNAGEEGRGDGV